MAYSINKMEFAKREVQEQILKISHIEELIDIEDDGETLPPKLTHIE